MYGYTQSLKGVYDAQSKSYIQKTGIELDKNYKHTYTESGSQIFLCWEITVEDIVCMGIKQCVKKTTQLGNESIEALQVILTPTSGALTWCRNTATYINSKLVVIE